MSAVRGRQRGRACSAWSAQIFNLYFVFMLILHFPQFSHPQSEHPTPSPSPLSTHVIILQALCETFSALQFLAMAWTMSAWTGYLPHEWEWEGGGLPVIVRVECALCVCVCACEYVCCVCVFCRLQFPFYPLRCLLARVCARKRERGRWIECVCERIWLPLCLCLCVCVCVFYSI